MNLQQFKDKYIHQINEKSLEFLETLNLASKLRESMIYSFTAGGKRIRPLLLLATVYGFRIEVEKGLNTACALELVHTSSLIHDDLPAMDNDDYRRGLLTNHKVYGEATAILAGDALLVNAFNLICDDQLLEDSQKIKLINELSRCSGANGMIGGQQLDIENENQPLNVQDLMKIHEHKTGKLIRYAIIAGAIIANKDDEVINALKTMAYHIGIAFQIKDDLLDVTGDFHSLGKLSSDEKNNKCTYATLLGIEGAKKQLEDHYKKAVTILDEIDFDKTLLKTIFNLIINRSK